MKCPVCTAQVSSVDIVETRALSAQYICPQCGTRLKRRLSTTMFVIFLLVGLPIVEYPIRLIVEPIVYSPQVRSVLGQIPPQVVSFAFAFAAAAIAFLAVDRLIPIAKPSREG